MMPPRSWPACSARSPHRDLTDEARQPFVPEIPHSHGCIASRGNRSPGGELAEQVEADIDIKALESRPEFQTLMSGLVDIVGK